MSKQQQQHALWFWIDLKFFPCTRAPFLLLHYDNISVEELSPNLCRALEHAAKVWRLSNPSRPLRKNSILVVGSTHLLAILPLEGIFLEKVGWEEVRLTLSCEKLERSDCESVFCNMKGRALWLLGFYPTFLSCQIFLQESETPSPVWVRGFSLLSAAACEELSQSVSASWNTLQSCTLVLLVH